MKASDLVGIRYAKAIYELAEEKKLVKEVYEILNFVKELYENENEFKLFVDSVLIEHSVKEKVISKILNTDEFLENIVLYIIKKDRISYIRNICSEYLKEYHRQNSILDIEATFTRKLTTDEKNRLEEILRKRTGKEISLKLNVDRSIIGGGMIKIGDQMIDGSLRNELYKLKNKKNL